MLQDKIAKFDINPLIVKDKKILLAKRSQKVEFGNCWHMPGGKVLQKERFLDCLKRTTLLKTGLEIEYLFEDKNNSIVGVYDDPDRDPREHVAGITFFCKVVGGMLTKGKNCSEVRFFSANETKNLNTAFGHDYMLRDGIKKLLELKLV